VQSITPSVGCVSFDERRLFLIFLFLFVFVSKRSFVFVAKRYSVSAVLILNFR